MNKVTTKTDGLQIHTVHKVRNITHNGTRQEVYTLDWIFILQCVLCVTLSTLDSLDIIYTMYTAKIATCVEFTCKKIRLFWIQLTEILYYLHNDL